MKIDYKHTIALIYTVVLFLDRLDLTIVNITLPTLASYFHVPIVNTTWVSLAFLIALAVSIPISSWLGDRFGLKKIYVIAIVLFGLGSTLCAIAPNLLMLTFFRFIQGIGGGLLIPVGMTMLYRAFDSAEYASITSFTFIPTLIAPAIAPFLGGILLDAFGWQAVFLFSGPICLILACYATIYLKETAEKIIKPLDWVGFFLTTVMLIDLFLTLSAISQFGFSLVVILAIILFIILLTIFIEWETTIQHPLIQLDFFKNKQIVQANLMQLCFQYCHFGALFLIVMYLQVGVGMQAEVAGLIIGMQAVGAMVSSRLSVKLFNLYGAKTPLTIGLFGLIILSPSILFITHPNMILFGIILFFVRGLFSGLCGTPLQTMSVINMPKENLNQINSIFNTCRQIAISLGVAISSVLISLGLKLAHIDKANYMTHHQALTVFLPGFIAVSVVAFVGILIMDLNKKAS